MSLATARLRRVAHHRFGLRRPGFPARHWPPDMDAHSTPLGPSRDVRSAVRAETAWKGARSHLVARPPSRSARGTIRYRFQQACRGLKTSPLVVSTLSSFLPPLHGTSERKIEGGTYWCPIRGDRAWVRDKSRCIRRRIPPRPTLRFSVRELVDLRSVPALLLPLLRDFRYA